MFYRIVLTLTLSLFLQLPAAGFSAQPKVAVLDFFIKGPAKYDHLKRSLAALLSFRIEQDKRLISIKRNRYNHTLFRNRTGYLSYNRLRLLNKKIRADYIIKGTLAIKNRIRLTLKMFSKKHGKPIMIFQKISNTLSNIFNLFDLAHLKICAKILGYRYRAPINRIDADILFAIDCGGRMHRVFPDIKKSLARLFYRLENVSPKIIYRNGLMFFKGGQIIRRTPFAKSTSSLISKFNGISAFGTSTRSFHIGTILETAANNYTWRKNVQRYLILYTNSPIGSFLSYQIFRLNRMGIKIICIAADGSSSKTFQELYELASRSNGIFQRADYLVDYALSSKRKRTFLLNNGRLYRLNRTINHFIWSRFSPQQAPDSLPGRIYRARSIDDASRIIKTINKKNIQTIKISSNLEEKILSAIKRIVSRRNVWFKYARPIGVAYLASGNSRLRLLISSHAILKRLKKYSKSKKTVWIGAEVVPASFMPEGAYLNPQSIMIPYNQKAIPHLVKIPLWRILSKAQFYATHGLFSPNRWFFKAKIVSLRRFNRVRFKLEE